MSHYTWNAADYEKHSGAQQQWARELIDKLTLSGTEHLLDVGCGEGKVTAELARYLPAGQIIGIDSAAEMIRLAQKRYPRHAHPNLSFSVMDARSITFAQRFDVVFSNAALHWIKDHRPVLAGIYQSLKPGGRILLQMGGQGNAAAMVAVLDECMAQPAWQPYCHDFDFPYGFFGAETYRTLLTEAGFNIGRIEMIPKTMEQNGKAGLMGWLRTTWLPYTQRLPQNLRETFIENIADHYLAQYPLTAAGKAQVGMMRIEIEASRPL
jgi:trans-aconitate methyltransferase